MCIYLRTAACLQNYLSLLILAHEIYYTYCAESATLHTRESNRLYTYVCVLCTWAQGAAMMMTTTAAATTSSPCPRSRLGLPAGGMRSALHSHAQLRQSVVTVSTAEGERYPERCADIRMCICVRAGYQDSRAGSDRRNFRKREKRDRKRLELEESTYRYCICDMCIDSHTVELRLPSWIAVHCVPPVINTPKLRATWAECVQQCIYSLRGSIRL